MCVCEREDKGVRGAKDTHTHKKQGVSWSCVYVYVCMCACVCVRCSALVCMHLACVCVCVQHTWCVYTWHACVNAGAFERQTRSVCIWTYLWQKSIVYVCMQVPLREARKIWVYTTRFECMRLACECVCRYLWERHVQWRQQQVACPCLCYW